MRTRIVTLAVLSATLAIVLFGLPLAAAGALYAEQYKVLDLERQAERSAVRVSNALAEGETPDGGDLDDFADLTFRSVYDGDGTWLLGRGPTEPDEFVLKALRGRVSTGSGDGQLIAAVPVVDKGDVIAHLDPQELQAAARSAEASLAQAEAQFVSARGNGAVPSDILNSATARVSQRRRPLCLS